MRYWKAHYRDEFHDEDILIANEEADKIHNLTFTIDGITFWGGDISNFELKEPSQVGEAMARFSLLKWGGTMSEINHTSPYVYTLQRYALNIQIPIQVVRIADGSEVEGILHVGYRDVPHDMEKVQIRFYCDDQRVWPDDLEVTDFRLCVDGEEFSVACEDLWFESNLQELIRMIAPKHRLKCCFTCQWSDYSPYGSDDFGTMLCYRAHKEEYLRVNSKNDYFEHLEELPNEQRQETYVCPDFAVRDQCEGYRGFVKE